MRKGKGARILTAFLICLPILLINGCGDAPGASKGGGQQTGEAGNTQKAMRRGKLNEAMEWFGLSGGQGEDGEGEGEGEDGEGADGGQEEEPAESISAGRYAYGTLGTEEKGVYDTILGAILAHEETVGVDTLDTDVLDQAYKAVSADYGNLFWVSGYVYTQYTRGDALVQLDFSPQYTMALEKREYLQRQIDARVEEIVSQVPAGASDYDKAKYVFDYLASNVDYDASAEENQNIVSVFLYGKTVCQGYANAAQYLLTELGIQSAVVTGEADGEPHAWNLAFLDGAYYYMDTTWGNSAYTGADTRLQRYINYNYFCVTSAEIGLTHTANDYFALPEAVSTEDNYYVREGKYFTEWDPGAMGEILKTEYEAGNVAASLKFGTEELYAQAKWYFMDEGHIMDYCAGLGSLYYMEDAGQRVLTFYFP